MRLGTFEGVEIDQIYREHLLDHYREPRNSGRIDGAEHFHDLNPLCGDEIEMFVEFDGGSIKDIKFTGQGCAISQASASILTEDVKGKDAGKIKELDFDAMQEMVGIKITAARVKCMMLPLKVLKTIVYLHEGKKLEEVSHVKD